MHESFLSSKFKGWPYAESCLTFVSGNSVHPEFLEKHIRQTMHAPLFQLTDLFMDLILPKIYLRKTMTL